MEKRNEFFPGTTYLIRIACGAGWLFELITSGLEGRFLPARFFPFIGTMLYCIAEKSVL